MIDDYTKMDVKTKIHGGEIEVCQYCGRLGLVKVVGGKIWVTHVQGMAYDSRNLNQAGVVEDECPKDGQTPLSAENKNPESGQHDESV
jgi:hypothetical protein